MPSLLIWRDWILVRFWELILEVCILLWLFLISFLEKTYVAYVFRGKRLTQTLHLMFFCPYVLLSPALAASAPRLGASPSLRVSDLSPNSWKICSTAQTCKISTPKLGIYTSKPYICPVGHKNSRPSAHRQISTFARQRARTGMSAARERKNARFFLHAATRWHSACYARFKRNSRKFLQNFFAKNLVCVPKVRTFALANQKWGLQHLTNLKQFDLWKHYIKLFCREVQETKWALFI